MKKIIASIILCFSITLQLYGATKNPDNLYQSPPIGINNYMGNSCFMNAAMQALYFVPPLTHYLFSPQFQTALAGNEDTVAGKYVTFLKELKDSPSAIETNHAKVFRDFITCKAMQADFYRARYSEILKKGKIDQERYDTLLSNLFEEAKKVPLIIKKLRGTAYPLEEIPEIDHQLTAQNPSLSIAQKNLYENLHPYKNLIPFFENQQDSDEFLMPLIDSLITVDKKNSSVKKILSFETKDTIQHKNITLTNKAHKTEKTDLHQKLILNFPQPLPTQPSEPISMESLLHNYFQREDMTGDNQWYCDTCDKLVDATKGVLLSTSNPMPEILVVQLNRFAYDMIEDLTTKIYNPVPLNNYLFLQSEYFSDSTAEPVYYKLISFVLHEGPFGGGHYTAFAQNPADNHWWYFDDSTTTKFEHNEINNVLAAGIYPHNGDLINKAASIFTPYLLFYQKTESPKQKIEKLTTALQALKLKLAQLATKLSTLK